MQQQAVPAAGVQLHRPELGARPAVVEPVRRRVRGGVTQIIRRDDLMTRRRGVGLLLLAQGHWLLGVAPPQFSRIYPHWRHHQPATLEADM